MHSSLLVEKLPVADRGIARNPQRLSYDLRIPYIVVEVAAITNWVEEGWFRSITFKERAADAMVIGLARYFLLVARHADEHGEPSGRARTAPVSVSTIPIRTHLIGENEDLVEVIRRYVSEILNPGDVVAVAESVVSITQGRAILPESVHPGLLAVSCASFRETEALLLLLRCSLQLMRWGPPECSWASWLPAQADS